MLTIHLLVEIQKLGFERIAVSVYRKGVSSLEMFDFKMSTPDLFEMPAGSVGLLLGFEWRNEEVVDDRDPRLDGTIPYTDYEGDTHPYVSDVVNSSPTNDVFGQRETTSLLAEALHSFNGKYGYATCFTS